MANLIGRAPSLEPAPRDRSALWLPFLQRLTDRFPRWAVWKNVRSALTGHGDVDSFAPRADWAAIEGEFRAWAAAEGLAPVIVCRHIPQGPHFIALEAHSPYLVQLDVKERATLRGGTLLDVDDLLALAEIDARGFRRIRPGAEGVIKLLLNGMSRGGHRDERALQAKGIVALLQQDPDGVGAIARRFGSAERPLLDAVAALLAGGWEQRALRAVERHAYLRALGEPTVAVSRLWFNAVASARCPVIRLIRQHDRRVPDDRAGWLAEVRRDHRVDAVDASPPVAMERVS